MRQLLVDHACRQRRHTSIGKTNTRGEYKKSLKITWKKHAPQAEASTLLSAPRSQPGIDLGSTQDRSDKKHLRKNIIRKTSSKKKHHPKKNIIRKTSSKKNIIEKNIIRKTSSKKNIIGRNTFRCFLLELRKAMEEER